MFLLWFISEYILKLNHHHMFFWLIRIVDEEDGEQGKGRSKRTWNKGEGEEEEQEEEKNRKFGNIVGHRFSNVMFAI